MRRMDDARRLAKQLKRHQAGVGKRYPTEVKRRVVAWAAVRREHGAGWAALGRELGLKLETVRRWCMSDAGQSGARALVRVEVKPEVEQQHFAVVSPMGFRVEGLSLSDVAELMRALG